MTIIRVGNSWRFEEDGCGPVKTGKLGIAHVQMSFDFDEDEHQKRKELGYEQEQHEFNFDPQNTDKKIEERADNPDLKIEQECEAAE